MSVAVILSITLAVIFLIGGIGHSDFNDSPQAIVAEPFKSTIEQEYLYIIEPGSTLYSSLTKLGISPTVIYQLVNEVKPTVDLRRMKAGTRFQVVYATNADKQLESLKFRFSPVDFIEIKKTGEKWAAEKISKPVETKIASFWGVVESTLWESAERAQMDPNLISELADIFAWQIDFEREVRVKDRWRISVEQKFVNDEPIGWGSIIAAEYENQGRVYSAALFRMNNKNLGYFAPDGSSLKRMFLKSPIRYGRISSRFKRKRFHPILKINRPHNGVDYAAPKGTPVRAVGSGTILVAGYRGGSGNMIKIRHNSVYETAYKHLSGFAKSVRSGSRVEQGQVIGYVGSTGLSTGSHLHFEFFRSNRYVDPLGQQFPAADPVPNQFMAAFQAEANARLNELPSWKSVEITSRDTASTPSL